MTISPVSGFMPWRERPHAANGPPAAPAQPLGYLTCLPGSPPPAPQPGFLRRMGQHLAAVRLRLDNLFIKQRIADRRERCVSRLKGALTREHSGWLGGVRGRAGDEIPGYTTSDLSGSPVSPHRGAGSGGALAMATVATTRSDYPLISSGSRYWSGSSSKASGESSCSRTSLISRKIRPGG